MSTLRRYFLRPSRPDNSGRGLPERRGTGLDLAPVKRLMELQEGSLQCTSVADVGTTFIVSFPGREEGDIR